MSEEAWTFIFSDETDPHWATELHVSKSQASDLESAEEIALATVTSELHANDVHRYDLYRLMVWDGWVDVLKWDQKALGDWLGPNLDHPTPKQITNWIGDQSSASPKIDILTPDTLIQTFWLPTHHPGGQIEMEAVRLGSTVTLAALRDRLRRVKPRLKGTHKLFGVIEFSDPDSLLQEQNFDHMKKRYDAIFTENVRPRAR